jgi:RNA polymerase sigma-70 factor, ECF subfamily
MDAMMKAAAFEEYRPYLTGHCYRMLGSVVDAEDAVQDTMLRAWKSADRFAARSTMKTWLYRIATNVCLDKLKGSKHRRVRPLELSDTPGVVHDDLVLEQREREFWVEPIPDEMALPSASSTTPEEHALLAESIRLAFVAALQYLPPKQRAALLLTQVLCFSAAETAATLKMSTAAVNSALQRARQTLDARNPAVVPRELSGEQTKLLERYVDAFTRYDVDALTSLLHEDATLSMPPYTLWLQGHESIARWLSTFGIGCKGSKLVPVSACGSTPAWAQYRDGGQTPWALLLLDVRGEKIASMTSYLDVGTLFPRFGVPLRLD